MQKSKTWKFHGFPPVTTKLHHLRRRAVEVAMAASEESCRVADMVGWSQTDPERKWHATYSMTSSASASNDGASVQPIALATLRLITNSNLVGSCTGSSAGLSPLRIRST